MRGLDGLKVAAPFDLTSDEEIDTGSLGVVLTTWRPALVVVEAVHAMPGQGVTSMFTFGKGFGMILGTCGALGFTVARVGPALWKRALGLTLPKEPKGVKRDAGAAKREGKGLTIAWVEKTFPGVSLLATARSRVPHDGMADAIAIAEYGMRFLAIKPV